MKNMLRQVRLLVAPKPHKKSKPAAGSSRRPSPQAAKSRRSSLVQFHDVDRVEKVLHILDYTDEEVEACWYTDFDSSEFKEESTFIAQLHSTPGLMVDEDEYPMRGLESIVHKDQDFREAKKRSIRVVLEEQQQQGSSSHSQRQHSTSFSQNRLATTYAMHTRDSEIRARLYALADEASVVREVEASFRAGLCAVGPVRRGLDQPSSRHELLASRAA